MKLLLLLLAFSTLSYAAQGNVPIRELIAQVDRGEFDPLLTAGKKKVNVVHFQENPAFAADFKELLIKLQKRGFSVGGTLVGRAEFDALEAEFVEKESAEALFIDYASATAGPIAAKGYWLGINQWKKAFHTLRDKVFGCPYGFTKLSVTGTPSAKLEKVRLVAMKSEALLSILAIGLSQPDLSAFQGISQFVLAQTWASVSTRKAKEISHFKGQGSTVSVDKDHEIYLESNTPLLFLMTFFEELVLDAAFRFSTTFSPNDSFQTVQKWGSELPYGILNAFLMTFSKMPIEKWMAHHYRKAADAEKHGDLKVMEHHENMAAGIDNVFYNFFFPTLRVIQSCLPKGVSEIADGLIFTAHGIQFGVGVVGLGIGAIKARAGNWFKKSVKTNGPVAGTDCKTLLTFAATRDLESLANHSKTRPQVAIHAKAEDYVAATAN